MEDEGDRPIGYWRKVHWDFFRQEYADVGLEFTEKSLVVQLTDLQFSVQLLPA